MNTDQYRSTISKDYAKIQKAYDKFIKSKLVTDGWVDDYTISDLQLILRSVIVDCSPDVLAFVNRLTYPAHELRRAKGEMQSLRMFPMCGSKMVFRNVFILPKGVEICYDTTNNRYQITVALALHNRCSCDVTEYSDGYCDVIAHGAPRYGRYYSDRSESPRARSRARSRTKSRTKSRTRSRIRSRTKTRTKTRTKSSSPPRYKPTLAEQFLNTITVPRKPDDDRCHGVEKSQVSFDYESMLHAL